MNTIWIPSFYGKVKQKWPSTNFNWLVRSTLTLLLSREKLVVHLTQHDTQQPGVHTHLKQFQKIGKPCITKGLATCQSLGWIFPCNFRCLWWTQPSQESRCIHGWPPLTSLSLSLWVRLLGQVAPQPKTPWITARWAIWADRYKLGPMSIHLSCGETTPGKPIYIRPLIGVNKLHL